MTLLKDHAILNIPCSACHPFFYPQENLINFDHLRRKPIGIATSPHCSP